jgi:hypothetical protein
LLYIDDIVLTASSASLL